MSDFIPPQLKPAAAIADGMVLLAQRLARVAARQASGARLKRGATLRPGTETPMWNTLVLAVRPHLRKWGRKSNLGRELGVPPQRIHEYFVARTAIPDAERTLLIMRWLAVQSSPPAPARHSPPLPSR